MNARYRTKFVLAPDGDFALVPRQADRHTYSFDDPQSLAATIEAIKPSKPSANASAIAKAMLDTDPSAIIAIYSDAKGRVLGTTITRTTNGHTPAAFRAAFRSLPATAKQVVFATCCGIPSDTRATINSYADTFLVRCVDILTIDP